MGKKTALYEQHQQANAKLVDFAGWDMPLHYGSQLEEHHFVRRDAGMFDVSHMVAIDITGSGTRDFLKYLLANNIDKLTTTGKALYSCMLNIHGGVVDDLIVYKLGDEFYRVVVNAGTRDKDLQWIKEQSANFDIDIQECDDVAIIAVQGPSARERLERALTKDMIEHVRQLKPFNAVFDNDWLIARTGYTGEDGCEIILPSAQVVPFWLALLAAGVKPCGLGARDTLRLEAGMNLYGSDMNDTTSPLVSGLSWTIAFEPENRDFIGKEALLAEKQNGVTQKLVGLILLDKGVLRDHQKVILEDASEGEITSGSFSPTLTKSIALARVPKTIGSQCHVEVRGKKLLCQVVKIPFVRNGQAVYKG